MEQITPSQPSGSPWSRLPVIPPEKCSAFADPCDQSQIPGIEYSKCPRDLFLSTTISSCFWSSAKHTIETTAKGSATGAFLGLLFGGIADWWLKCPVDSSELNGSVQPTSSTECSALQTTQGPHGFSKASIGATIGWTLGTVVGAGWGLFQAAREVSSLTVNLRTIHSSVWEESEKTIERANKIFKCYLKEKKLKPDKELFCPLTEKPFVYPVQADDGEVYEHYMIFYHVSVTYANAMEKYQKDLENYKACVKESSADSNKSSLPSAPDRPSSSPFRKGKEVRLDNLKLRTDIMESISEAMKKLFDDLNRLCPFLQDELKKRAIEHVSGIRAKAVEDSVAIDEESIAKKLASGNDFISIKEALLVLGIFEHYVKQIQKRDEEVYKSITKSLTAQWEQDVISTERYHEEVTNLGNWFKKVRGVHQYGSINTK